jgi:hypothetical protein
MVKWAFVMKSVMLTLSSDHTCNVLLGCSDLEELFLHFRTTAITSKFITSYDTV